MNWAGPLLDINTAISSRDLRSNNFTEDLQTKMKVALVIDKLYNEKSKCGQRLRHVAVIAAV